jgi:hypothetical protein
VGINYMHKRNGWKLDDLGGLSINDDIQEIDKNLTSVVVEVPPTMNNLSSCAVSVSGAAEISVRMGKPNPSAPL